MQYMGYKSAQASRSLSAIAELLVVVSYLTVSLLLLKNDAK